MGAVKGGLGGSVPLRPSNPDPAEKKVRSFRHPGKRPLYFACVLRFVSALFFISHTESIFLKINDNIEWDLKKLLVPTCRVQGFQSRKTPCSRR